jgi:hypothetical protein
MNAKKILGLSILLLALITAILLVLNTKNSYYLVDQDGETHFEPGDVIYAQLDKPELLIVSVDGSEPFIPDYEREDKAILAYDLLPGEHTITIQQGKTTVEHTVNVEKTLHIPFVEFENLIPQGAQRLVTITAAGFTTAPLEDGKAHWITLDIHILDEDGMVIEEFLDAAESVGPEQYKKKLHYVIDTSQLELKRYTLRATLTDKLTGEQVSKEVSFLVTL